MQTISINTASGQSDIHNGENYRQFRKYIPEQKQIIILIDANVNDFYGESFSAFSKIIVPVGEKNKNLETVSVIYDKLIAIDCDRSSFLLGVGGGITCDIVGYVASTYMRGLDFGFISTSLLSQVDASVGGKTGVNFKNIKNLIGTFSLPKFVICDTEMLQTLPKNEIRNGMAEIIKHSLIDDVELFLFLEKNIDNVMSLDKSTIQHLVTKSISIKAKYVMNDFNDFSERRILNFGHSFGHAIERLLKISHGEAVSIGMSAASDISVKLANLSQNENIRIKKLLKSYGLPIVAKYNVDAAFEILKNDKKKNQNIIDYILLNGIGKSLIKKMPISALKELL